MYKLLIRPLLFLIDPERIHHFTFAFIRFIVIFPGVKSILRLFFEHNDPKNKRKILGLTFSNPVGLAAGFDKDAKLAHVWDCFGFGFVEIGTVTPEPQPGNDKPRLFRLPKDQAIINRMGFNNRGALAAAERLKGRSGKLIVGGNIGKNRATPNEEASNDYRYCFEALYPYVDYFAVNVSSPNTPGLRDLQDKAPLRDLLLQIKGMNEAKDEPKPILLKISPDLSVGQLDDVIEILKVTGTDGVIATNTTISREGLTSSASEVERMGAGGLSGRPLTKGSLEMIRYLRSQLGPDFPIIGVGGIMTPVDAVERLKAGADLVQVYTGFIYEGPGFIKRINKALAEKNTTELKVQVLT